MIKRAGFLVLIVWSSLLGCQQKLDIPEEELLDVVAAAVPDHALETLTALEAADPPPAILPDLAARLTQADLTPPEPPQNEEGDVETFWFLRNATFNEQIEATLRYQSDALNLWIAEGAKVSDAKLLDAADHLENSLLPTTRNLFGTESEGIDGDGRLNILHLDAIGDTGDGTAALGYFFNGDRVPQGVNPYSNEREMIYISIDRAKVAEDSYYGTIAHELQHLIHDTIDHNEFSWVDEGFAELSNAVNGIEVANVKQFAQLPDVQLNDWSHGTHEDLPHYGASYLFNQYVLDRFGEAATKEVVQNAANGFPAYDAMLAAHDMTADQFFGDWIIANYLTSIGKAAAPWMYETVTMEALPETAVTVPSTANATVSQYGTDYLKIDQDAPFSFSFTGSTQVSLLDIAPHSGDYFWTTYPADRSDMSLTKAFDLGAAAVTTATLEFWTWYEIEAGWDYGYVLVSADGGTQWEMLADPFYATAADPQGNNFGYAYTGNSGAGTHGEWTQIRIDISDYIGQDILVRFEYVTDQAVFEAGWAIDDITIPELDYSEDFEDGEGEWQGAGWVRHTNVLPQQYLLQAIYLGDEVQVETLALDDEQNGVFEIDPAGNEVVITVSGLTPITTQRTGYEYAVE